MPARARVHAPPPSPLTPARARAPRTYADVPVPSDIPRVSASARLSAAASQRRGAGPAPVNISDVFETHFVAALEKLQKARQIIHRHIGVTRLQERDSMMTVEKADKTLSH